MNLADDFDIASLLIHADTFGNEEASVGAPISTSTTFRAPYPNSPTKELPLNDEGQVPTAKNDAGTYENYMDPERHVYSRYTQPTLTRVEKVLSALLKSHALLLSSGLSAVFCAMLHYQPEVIAIQRGYHGSHETIALYTRTRPDVKVIDLDDDYEAYKDKRFVCWLETPVNPEGTARDIARYVSKTRALPHGSIVVDATFGPPPMQDPFEYDVDMIMHSATKYFAGHSDTLAGVLAVKSPEIWHQLWSIRTYSGMVPGSLECWLLLRSLRTVNLRVPRQAETATAFAKWLNEVASNAPTQGSSHDGCPGGFIKRVWHASLQAKETGFDPLSPSVDGKKAQMTVGSACFSILTVEEDYAKWLPHTLKLMVPATSLGGVESLIEQRVLSDAKSHPCQLRISVGLENIEDLKQDFRQGIKAVLEKLSKQ